MKTFSVTQIDAISEYIQKNLEKAYQLYIVQEGINLVICSKLEYKTVFEFLAADTTVDTVNLVKIVCFNPEYKTYYQAVREAYFRIFSSRFNAKEGLIYSVVKLPTFGYELIVNKSILSHKSKQDISALTKPKQIKGLTFRQRFELSKLISRLKQDLKFMSNE